MTNTPGHSIVIALRLLLIRLGLRRATLRDVVDRLMQHRTWR